MITILRPLIKHLRTVFRRAFSTCPSSRARSPVVFDASSQELVIHSQKEGMAVAYHLPGCFSNESIVLPAQALQDLEGKGKIQLPAGTNRSGQMSGELAGRRCTACEGV